MSFHPQNQKDKLVRATDLDALSCRLSADQKGYFSPSDIFIHDLFAAYEQNLQHCEGYTQLSAGRAIRATFSEQKFPLINRGTYFRTQCIDMVVSQFIREHDRCQIVALGGGSDTRSFRVLASYDNVHYTEIDFSESTRIKKIAISKSARLRDIVGTKIKPIEVSSKDEMENVDPELSGERYRLVAFDLRKVRAEGADKFSFLDRNLPTLVISECVLCYLTPEQNVEVLTFWKNFLSTVAVLLYDPMSLGDAFGNTMAQNLTKRGLDLLTFTQYPDLYSRKALFESVLGYKAYLTDLASVGGYAWRPDSWIDKRDLARVSALEMIDEVEEIELLLRHYCLIYAESGKRSEFAQRMKWIL